MLRLLVMNKNNCLDYLDSSGWPVDLLAIMEEVRAINLGEHDGVHKFKLERK